MSQSSIHLNPPSSRKYTIWIVLAVLALGAGAGWYWNQQQQEPATAAPAEEGQAFPWATTTNVPDVLSSAASEAAAFKITPDEAERQQVAAARAAEQAAGAKPVVGPVVERPAFVSELEWLALRQVAAQHPDGQKELNRLVNQLRFLKRVEAWRTPSASVDPAQRRVLAESLLAEVPTRVANGEMDVPTAQQMQQALLAELVSDPDERSRRAGVEAKRLHPPAAPAQQPAQAGS